MFCEHVAAVITVRRELPFMFIASSALRKVYGLICVDTLRGQYAKGRETPSRIDSLISSSNVSGTLPPPSTLYLYTIIIMDDPTIFWWYCWQYELLSHKLAPTLVYDSDILIGD